MKKQIKDMCQLLKNTLIFRGQKLRNSLTTSAQLLFDESSIEGIQYQIKLCQEKLQKFNIEASEVDFDPDCDVKVIQDKFNLTQKEAEKVWRLFQSFWFNNYVLEKVMKDGSFSFEFPVSKGELK